MQPRTDASQYKQHMTNCGQPRNDALEMAANPFGTDSSVRPFRKLRQPRIWAAIGVAARVVVEAAVRVPVGVTEREML